MNKRQKISLIGFFIGLIMITYLSIDSNEYTRYVVMLGYAISLSSAFMYSLFRYDFKSIKPINKKINNESIKSEISSNVSDIGDSLHIQIVPNASIEKNNYFENFIPDIQKSQYIIKSRPNPELPTLFSSIVNDEYKHYPNIDIISKNEPFPDIFKDQAKEPSTLVLYKPLDYCN